MNQALSELVCRRSKLMASGDWVGFGWLTAKLNPNLRDRSLYFGIVIDGMSEYFLKCELALFRSGQEVLKFQTVICDTYSMVAYSGSSTGWDAGAVGNYSRVWPTTGFPSCRVVSAAEETQDFSDAGAADALVWSALTDNGTFKRQHRVTSYPFRVISEADELRFRFLERSGSTYLTWPSAEVLICCRSLALIR